MNIGSNFFKNATVNESSLGNSCFRAWNQFALGQDFHVWSAFFQIGTFMLPMIYIRYSFNGSDKFLPDMSAKDEIFKSS